MFTYDEYGETYSKLRAAYMDLRNAKCAELPVFEIAGGRIEEFSFRGTKFAMTPACVAEFRARVDLLIAKDCAQKKYGKILKEAEEKSNISYEFGEEALYINGWPYPYVSTDAMNRVESDMRKDGIYPENTHQIVSGR